MVQKRTPSLHQIEIDRDADREDISLKILAGADKNISASGVYEDKDRLPVMYDAASGTRTGKQHQSGNQYHFCDVARAYFTAYGY